MRRRTISLAAAVGSAAALTVAVTPAMAANGPPANASCVGAGSSALAPGQGFGTPGERAAVSHLVNSAPGPGGQTVKTFAQQKGTAAECFPAGPPA